MKVGIWDGVAKLLPEILEKDPFALNELPAALMPPAFHDLRRAFATANAANLDADELQRLMRHKCFTTTQRYVNMAQRVNAAVGKLSVPARLQQLAT